MSFLYQWVEAFRTILLIKKFKDNIFIVQDLKSNPFP